MKWVIKKYNIEAEDNFGYEGDDTVEIVKEFYFFGEAENFLREKLIELLSTKAQGVFGEDEFGYNYRLMSANENEFIVREEIFDCTYFVKFTIEEL